MIRTPPNHLRQSADTPLPATPDGESKTIMNKNSSNESHDSEAHSPSYGDNLSEDNPTPFAPRPSPGLEDLSDKKIIKQIKNLQRLLESRYKKRKPKKNLSNDPSLRDIISPGSLSPIDLDPFVLPLLW
ncbi:hypothetical protein QE152_g29129 [Popillia japonica]|uniref:Uncharacterized protein n=1 Tax=Popillia japonica TaxID=7064 RepID=A0AAW1JIT6_POPJA